MFDIDIVNKFCLALTEANTFNVLINRALNSYPNECCGFVYNDGSVKSVPNNISILNNPALNTKNSFLIDSESLSKSIHLNKQIFAIYHSHNDGSGDLSEFDIKMLRNKNFAYIIISIIDNKFNEIKIHWLNNNDEFETLKMK